MVIWPIIGDIFASFIWETLSEKITIIKSGYVSIRGEWAVLSKYNFQTKVIEISESVNIKQQWGKYFSGILYSPDHDNPGNILELNVRGEFKDKYTAIFWAEHRLNQYTDISSGIVKFSASHKSAVGGSANFGISSPNQPTTITFSLSKT